MGDYYHYCYYHYYYLLTSTIISYLADSIIYSAWSRYIVCHDFKEFLRHVPIKCCQIASMLTNVVRSCPRHTWCQRQDCVSIWELTAILEAFSDSSVGEPPKLSSQIWSNNKGYTCKIRCFHILYKKHVQTSVASSRKWRQGSKSVRQQSGRGCVKHSRPIAVASRSYFVALARISLWKPAVFMHLSHSMRTDHALEAAGDQDWSTHSSTLICESLWVMPISCCPVPGGF